MGYAATVQFIVAMIIMMNPLGSLSVFIDLTKRFPLIYKQKTAVSCTITVVSLMLVSIWLGAGFLDLLGISMPSFRFAGGIILLLIGLSMLQSQESAVSHTPEDDEAAASSRSIAIVPLAIPLIVGPGTISTLVIASIDYPHTPLKLWLSGWCIILAFCSGLMLYYAHVIHRIVGESIIMVITRIMGMIIMSIAVGMLADGITGLIPALT